MQSTSAAIAAAAISGADLGARANSSKGSSAATVGSNGFDASEAEAWMQARWKSVQTSLTDKKIPDTRKSSTTGYHREARVGLLIVSLIAWYREARGIQGRTGHWWLCVGPEQE